MADRITLPMIARACGVDPKTVQAWAKKGSLAVERTRGGHARVHRNEAVRFLRAHGFPVPAWLGATRPRVRLGLADERSADAVAAWLLGAPGTAASPELAVERAPGLLAALAAFAREVPDALVVDPGEVAAVRAALALEPATRQVRVAGGWSPTDAEDVRARAQAGLALELARLAATDAPLPPEAPPARDP